MTDSIYTCTCVYVHMKAYMFNYIVHTYTQVYIYLLGSFEQSLGSHIHCGGDNR